MSKEYERIRSDISAKYKGEIANLKNELAKTQIALNEANNELKKVKEENNRLSNENKQLREFLGKTDKEIDGLLKAKNGISAITTMMSLVGDSPYISF